MLKIERRMSASPLRNFEHLLYATDGSFAAAVDPWDGAGVAEWLQSLGLRLSHVLHTHEHHDHIRGTAELLRRYPAQSLAMPGATGVIAGCPRPLSDGETLYADRDCSLICRATPGHTPHHMSLFLFQLGQVAAVLCGDTVFQAGVGHCRSGSPSLLFRTLQQHFVPLPDAALLYPGHDYLLNNLRFTLSLEKDNAIAASLLGELEGGRRQSSEQTLSVGLERQINLFFRLQSPAVLAALRSRGEISAAAPRDEQVFLALRRLRDAW
ncbi:MAG: MBL fold metallo-hydrolase [Leptospirales bacterium]|nr:MBL fold metallo-hydrolase [Leptospirales bacterium]